MWESHQERRRFGVTGANSHLPSSKGVTQRREGCILPGASSGQLLISGRKAFTKGISEEAPPGAATAFTLLGGATYCP
ncbi:hypothetical protein Cadr_000008170 [Camelus dromedarius]|uniref:Uncharacterized protein n=1 Tax=Camelus dromedarius TaxID=9838 RepID=A0A5N4DY74_CAMDR|nr:hypothetical protein Cadr_000008170 [Camelus dromedarius]